MIHVVAVITAKPGLRAQVLQAFQANCALVRAEKGCIEYVATVDAPGMPGGKGRFGEDTFVVVEKWASLEDLKAHAAAPHMAAYSAKTKDWVAERLIHVLEPAQ
jgi:quinol monooxygenase YgiN